MESAADFLLAGLADQELPVPPMPVCVPEYIEQTHDDAGFTGVSFESKLDSMFGNVGIGCGAAGLLGC